MGIEDTYMTRLFKNSLGTAYKTKKTRLEIFLGTIKGNNSKSKFQTVEYTD
jgi:hypothetical protein